MLSGSRTNLAIKVFGPELTVLRSLAGRIGDVVAGVPGIVDLDRESMARHGLTPAAMARAVEALFQGVVVSPPATECCW